MYMKKIEGQFRPEKREFFEMRGPDALRFAAGLFTSDLRRAARERFGTARTLLLSTKAKIVCVARYVVQTKEHIVFSVPVGTRDTAIAHLNARLIADDLELAPLPDDAYCVCTAILPDSKVDDHRIPTEIPDARDLVFQGSDGDGVLRLPCGNLGPHHFEVWQTSQTCGATLEESVYQKLRQDHGVPEWGSDLSEESFCLEFPFEDAISFHKGCYLGQEVVARGTYRGKVVKFFSLFSSSQEGLSPGFVFGANPDQPVGKITSVFEGRGLGVLRLTSATETLWQPDPNRGKRVALTLERVFHEGD